MRVSIIIPAFNAAAYLQRSIDSAIRAGTRVRGAYELILVDNDSTDATPAIIAAAARDHPKVVKAAFTATPGAPAARNHGVSLSRGEWLQFLDADDTLAADKIEHQLSLAGGADWVIGAYRNLYADGSREDVLPHPEPWLGLFHNYRTGHTISNLLRRRALDRVGGWDESLPSNQDPDLHFRLLKAAVPFVLDPEVKSYYHHHDGDRITSSGGAARYRQRVMMLAEANTYLYTSRRDYWQAHAPYLLGALLRSMRLLATYDLKEAARAYATYFGPSSYWRTHAPYELVPRYTQLYPYVGFRNLEQLRLSLTGALPDSVKRVLKS